MCDVLTTPWGTPILIAVVADGAGSASHSQIGAEIVCTETVAELTAFFSEGGNITALDREFAVQTIKRLQSKIALCADSEGIDTREFASTLLVAIIGEERTVTWQIGDGAIVYSDPNRPQDYSVVNWPEKDEYENVTVFVTQSSSTRLLQFDSVQTHVDEIALLTDGIQRLALDFASQNAHAPFFRDMFGPLRSERPGRSERASFGLAALLGSPRVNQRTDDDKTLILASRRSLETESSGPGSKGTSGPAPAIVSQVAATGTTILSITSQDSQRAASCDYPVNENDDDGASVR